MYEINDLWVYYIFIHDRDVRSTTAYCSPFCTQYRQYQVSKSVLYVTRKKRDAVTHLQSNMESGACLLLCAKLSCHGVINKPAKLVSRRAPNYFQLDLTSDLWPSKHPVNLCFSVFLCTSCAKPWDEEIAILFLFGSPSRRSGRCMLFMWWWNTFRIRPSMLDTTWVLQLTMYSLAVSLSIDHRRWKSKGTGAEKNKNSFHHWKAFSRFSFSRSRLL